jgi:putative iron-only hydrogenase system regulator
MEIFMRLGVVAVAINDRSRAVQVQLVISQFADIIIARTGIPDHQTGQSVISLIVKGTVEQISALCGKLGKIADVEAKSALTSAKEN